MYSPRQNEPPMDAKKYDQHASQWMREAMDSRLVIEELRAHNDKLQRELYAANSQVALIHECLGDLNISDRVSDLMQKKIRAFQLAQHAKQNPPPLVTASAASFNSPRQRKALLDAASNSSSNPPSDEGFICGSSAFQQTAGYSSSYEGQVSRETFHRKKVFECEEAQYREKLDIFGNAKQVSPKGSHARRGDAIDSLLSSNAPDLGRQPQAGGSSRSYGAR